MGTRRPVLADDKYTGIAVQIFIVVDRDSGGRDQVARDAAARN